MRKSPHPVNDGAEILSGDLHWEEFPHDLRTVPVPASDQATSPLHDLVLQQSLDLLLQIQDSILVGRLIVQLLWLQYKILYKIFKDGNNFNINTFFPKWVFEHKKWGYSE